MADEGAGPEAGGEASASADPAAMAMAMGSASHDEADAFLRDRRKLIEDQRHHLHEQFKSLRLTIWEKRMGVLLRIATALLAFLLPSCRFRRLRVQMSHEDP
jgi:hypothetical protein